jgi:undecaprenyl-diphosphatase
VADPVGDGAIVVGSLAFTILSNLILGTGEVRPQQIASTFRTNELLSIDRVAIRQKIDPNADRFSNYGRYVAIAFVVGDTVADVFRVDKVAALVDAVMYSEATFITQSVTNLTKIAFRRPRPNAYIARQQYLDRGGDPNTYDNADTDSSLSFFSGHASGLATLSSAATYIAFSRSSPHHPRPWLTLVGGALVTSFVSYERIRSGDHFPTDVIAGAIAGAGIGALVVHLHREDAVRQRPVWIGATPVPNGGVIGASGFF